MALSYLGDAGLLAGSFVLLIATFITASNEVTAGVYVLNLLIALPALLSLVVKMVFNRTLKTEGNEKRSGREPLLNSPKSKAFIEKLQKGLALPSAAVILVFAPAIALFLMLILRLFLGEEAFEGYASMLDYGWKYGIEDGDPNVAFVPEFNSYGHCIQGVLAAWFAFPAVSGLVTQTLTCQWKQLWLKCNETVRSLVTLASWVLTIYPSYNLIKRFSKAGEAFAGSSFANNGLEWAYGFMMGIAFGSLTMSLVITRLSRQISSNNANDEAWIFGTQKEESLGRGRVCLKYFQLLLGFLLLFSVFAAAVLFGQTWQNCLDGDKDCVNYSEDAVPMAIQVAFVVVPVILISAAIIRECYKTRQ